VGSLIIGLSEKDVRDLTEIGLPPFRCVIAACQCYL